MSTESVSYRSWKRPTLVPRGSIVRSMRDTEKETDADGTERKRTVTGAGCIFRIHPEIEGMKPSEVRRAFARFANSLGCFATVVEANAGHYSQRGKAIEHELPSAYQVIGEPDALQALLGHFTVEGWEPALNVRVPHIAAGSGAEKIRASAKSAFSRPETRQATAEVLHTAQQQRSAADLRAEYAARDAARSAERLAEHLRNAAIVQARLNSAR